MDRGSCHNKPLRRWLALWAVMAFLLAEAAFAAHEIDHVEMPGAQCLEAACAICDLEASSTAPLRTCANNGLLTSLPLLGHAMGGHGQDVNCGLLPADPAAPRAPPLHA